MANYFIGFDCGTQGTKVAIYADDSTLMAEAYREHTIDYPRPGWAEMNPGQFYKAVKEGIRECVQKAGIEKGDVKGISCSGIVCGFVPITEKWEAAGPYVLYLDGRSSREARDISENIEPLWIEESGNCDVGTFMPPVILKWYLNNDPDFLKKTKKVVTNSQYVMGKLGGFNASDAYMDWGHLSGWVIGYNALKRDWSSKQIDALGIPAEILPVIRKPWDVVGAITREQSGELGLKEGTPLVAGSGDVMQSNIGSGVVEFGMCSDVAGTASIFTVDVDRVNERITQVPGILYSMCTLDNHYIYWGYIRAGGLSLGWFRDEILARKGDDEFFKTIDTLAEKASLGSDFSLFYPYLQGGDPSMPDASGTWLGLFGSSNTATMWRSMLEAIAFEYLSWINEFNKAGISINQIIGTGGGSRSPVWNQIKADVLNKTYATLQRSEGAVLGNALLAAYGTENISNIQETIKSWVEIRETFSPRKHNTEAYGQIYKKRQELLAGPMKEVFKKMAELHEIKVPRNEKM